MHPHRPRLIEPFRAINNYGLFAVMTRAALLLSVSTALRLEPLFASLGTVSGNPWVMAVQQRLLANDRDAPTQER